MFSRDNLKGTIKKTECGIINLDDTIGSGTYWVCYYNYYYFNPFEMPPPVEVVRYINIMIFNIKTLKVFFVDIIVGIS